MVDSDMVEKLTAALMWWSSLNKVSASILMFLPILTASAVAEELPAAATISNRGGCIVTCSPIGAIPTAEMNISRSQVI